MKQKSNSEKIFYDPGKVKDNTKLLSGIEEILKLSGGEFKRIRTTSTARYIQSGKEIYVLPKTDLTGNDVNFIGKVKRHFNNLELPVLLSKDKPYYEYFRPVSTYQEIDTLTEIDLTAAYYTAAKNLGYIDDKLYNLAFDGKISKKARLIAMGTLGKRSVETTFKAPYDNIVHIESYDRNRPFWDNIVFTVGELMREVVRMYKPHVYGMWFDAVFVESSVVESIRKFMSYRGYPVHSKKIESYIIKPRNGAIPGATIKRIYANGKTKKEMYVNYIDEKDKMLTFEDFLAAVIKTPYL